MEVNPGGSSKLTDGGNVHAQKMSFRYLPSLFVQINQVDWAGKDTLWHSWETAAKNFIMIIGMECLHA